MKHSWANAENKEPGYFSRDICKYCGIIRKGFIDGRWKRFRYYSGNSPLPVRPDCTGPKHAEQISLSL